MPIPAGTGTFPGAVFVQPLPVPPSAASSPTTVSSASGAMSNVVSNFGSSTSGLLSFYNNDYSAFTSFGSMRPTHASSGVTSATANPYPRPGPVSSGGPSYVPIPVPSSSAVVGGIGINVNIDTNQTTYINSAEYGAEGYEWWQCSESDISAVKLGFSAAVEDDGTCVVNVAVMEYVHVIGEIRSTETVYLTTYHYIFDEIDFRTTIFEDCVCPTLHAVMGNTKGLEGYCGAWIHHRMTLRGLNV